MEDANYQKSFLRIEVGGHTAEITELLVTSDGKQVITSGLDKTVRIWDVNSRKEIGKILGQIDSGHSGVIQAMALSPDDKYLVTSVYSGPGHKYSQPPHDPEDVLIRIYDFEKREIIKVISPGTTHLITALDFSADGKYLVAAAAAKTFRVFLFEELLLPDEADKKTPWIDLGLSQSMHKLNSVKIFKYEDDYRIVLAGIGKRVTQVHLYSLAYGKYIKAYSGGRMSSLSKYQEHIYLNISQDYIVVTDSSHKILIFDHDLNLKKTIVSEPNPEDAIFSPDGKHLLVGATETTDNPPIHCNVYDVDNDFRLLTTFTEHDAKTQAVEFIDNTTALSCGGNQKEMFFWDISTGEIKGKIEPVGSTIYALGIDGNRIAFGFTEDYKKDQNNYAPLEKVFDLNTFTISELEEGEVEQFKRARVEKDGLKLLIDPSRGFDLIMEKDGLGYVMYREGPWYYHETFGFTDYDFIVSGGQGGEVTAFSKDGYAKAKFVGHAGKVWDLATHNNRMVTGGVGQVIKLWKVDPLKELEAEIYPMLNIFISTEDEWVVWSQHGYYHASTNGDKHIGYHLNQGELEEALFYTSDRFIKALFRPDIVRAILETGSEKAALERFNIDLSKQVEMMLPPKVKLLCEDQISTDQKSFSISFEVTSGSDKATRVWVLRDEKFYWEQRDENGEVEGHHALEVHLMPGKNILKILAESIVSKSNPVEVLIDATGMKVIERGGGFEFDEIEGPDEIREVQPNLYLLAIGVSKYKPNAKVKDLNYAHLDAQQVVASFEGQAEKLFKTVDSKLLINDDATRSNILDAIGWLKSTVSEREKLKQDNNQISRDVVVVFLAGHGIKENDKFYFLNHDCDLNDLDNTAISLLDLGEVIGVLSAEVVMFTDACHAGKISTDLKNLIDSNELSKRLCAINERAQVILNATTAGKPAYELEDLSHGIFTNVLLKGLKDREEVTILHLADFVSYNVKRQTKDFSRGAQTPILTIFGSLDNYEISVNPE